jgi:hypothetical protein
MVPCISDDNNELKTNQMHNSLKIIKILLYSYSAPDDGSKSARNM